MTFNPRLRTEKDWTRHDVESDRPAPGLFRDRHEAGRLLAAKLSAYANRPDLPVLALPRPGRLTKWRGSRVIGSNVISCRQCNTALERATNRCSSKFDIRHSEVPIRR
jgi:hypothetical protein